MSAHEYATGPPELHADWCRQHFAMIREGGVWAVPRSGIIFTKRNGGLVWTVAMPWMPEMEGTITAEQLAEQQESDYEAIREHFRVAGIEVTREVDNAETSA